MAKSLQEEAQKTRIFIIMRKNYKCTRGHKRSVYKYSLHVNNREIDQEKQNKTVAR